MQGFSNEINKSGILDILCAMSSFENVNKGNREKQLQSDACDLGLQHMADMDIADAATKQEGKDEVGKDELNQSFMNNSCIYITLNIYNYTETAADVTESTST